MPKTMTGGKGPAADKLHLVAQVYEFVCQRTESFEDAPDGEPYVADALYLVGAIAKGTKCEWPRSRPLVRDIAKERPALFGGLSPYLTLTRK